MLRHEVKIIRGSHDRKMTSRLSNKRRRRGPCPLVVMGLQLLIWSLPSTPAFMTSHCPLPASPSQLFSKNAMRLLPPEISQPQMLLHAPSRPSIPKLVLMAASAPSLAPQTPQSQLAGSEPVSPPAKASSPPRLGRVEAMALLQSLVDTLRFEQGGDGSTLSAPPSVPPSVQPSLVEEEVEPFYALAQRCRQSDLPDMVLEVLNSYRAMASPGALFIGSRLRHALPPSFFFSLPSFFPPPPPFFHQPEWLDSFCPTS